MHLAFRQLCTLAHMHVPHAMKQHIACLAASLAGWLAADTAVFSFTVIPEGTEEVGPQIPANPGLLAEVARLLQAAPAGEQCQLAAAAMTSWLMLHSLFWPPKHLHDNGIVVCCLCLWRWC